MSKVFQQGLTKTGPVGRMWINQASRITKAARTNHGSWISPVDSTGVLLNEGMQFDRRGLKLEGFSGFRPIRDLDVMRIPQRTGVFAVLAPEGFQPRFLKKSTAGVFKKKDPSLPDSALAAEWVDNAAVLYVGKAGPGSKGNRGLRRQIQEFVDFGHGKPPGHWDGRLIWQLADAGQLVIAWKELPAEHLTTAEADYHTAFVEEYGVLPFANLVRARAKG